MKAVLKELSENSTVDTKEALEEKEGAIRRWSSPSFRNQGDSETLLEKPLADC